MTRFELPSSAGFPTAEKIGKYLTAQLGPSYKFEHQDDELAQTFGGRRGALGRWLNESIFGDMTVVVSNNPLFGTAIRIYEQGSSALLVVQGIIPHATLRKKVFPILGMLVGLGALIGINHWIGGVIFLGWLPLYFLIPRLCAMSLTAKVGRLLADADACLAAGIDPPPVSTLARLTPAQAGRIRAFGLARIVLGLVIVVAATIFAMTELGRPYASRSETLFLFSIAAGFGLMWVYVGIGRWSLRHVGWLKSGLMLVAFCGLCAGTGALVAARAFPPRQPPIAIPQAQPAVDKNDVDKNKE